MFEIKGKINTAFCYATVCEEDAIEQIKRMCDYEFTENSKIRIMPDVHSGKGCTIGTTMTVENRVVPNIVGVDIGCGMYTVELGDVELDLPKIDEIAHIIPSGKNIWEGKVENFDFTSLRCYRSLKKAKRLKRSLGTLGGGNHFIEIDVSKNGTKYLIIHSGSRNLGKQVAEIYQSLAIDLCSGKEDFFKKKSQIIEQYKFEDRKDEIQTALKMLEKDYKDLKPKIPEDLCYLYDSFLEDYLYDVEICQKFAKRSREKMAEIILDYTNMKAVNSFHTIHNYIDTAEMILRKGAVSAQKDEILLIPVNMRDGSILAKGKGNPEWNFSAPHGAGRILSRSKAKEVLNEEEYKKSMEGIYSTSVNVKTLDEAPMAYKSIDDIINILGDSVEIIEVLKPVYNFKAS